MMTLSFIHHFGSSIHSPFWTYDMEHFHSGRNTVIRFYLISVRFVNWWFLRVLVLIMRRRFPIGIQVETLGWPQSRLHMMLRFPFIHYFRSLTWSIATVEEKLLSDFIWFPSSVKFFLEDSINSIKNLIFQNLQKYLEIYSWFSILLNTCLCKSDGNISSRPIQRECKIKRFNTGTEFIEFCLHSYI